MKISILMGVTVCRFCFCIVVGKVDFAVFISSESTGLVHLWLFSDEKVYWFMLLISHACYS